MFKNIQGFKATFGGERMIALALEVFAGNA